MVHTNANLDLKTNEIIRTDRLYEAFYDLCEEETVRITFVARDTEFLNEAWREDGESFLRVVLPYKEVLSTDNVDLLIAERLYEELDKLEWLDVAVMRQRLKSKMAKIK